MEREGDEKGAQHICYVRLSGLEIGLGVFDSCLNLDNIRGRHVYLDVVEAVQVATYDLFILGPRNKHNDHLIARFRAWQPAYADSVLHLKPTLYTFNPGPRFLNS